MYRVTIDLLLCGCRDYLRSREFVEGTLCSYLAIEVWELKRDERRCGSQEDVEDGKTWKARRFGR